MDRRDANEYRRGFTEGETAERTRILDNASHLKASLRKQGDPTLAALLDIAIRQIVWENELGKPPPRST